MDREIRGVCGEVHIPQRIQRQYIVQIFRIVRALVRDSDEFKRIHIVVVKEIRDVFVKHIRIKENPHRVKLHVVVVEECRRRTALNIQIIHKQLIINNNNITDQPNRVVIFHVVDKIVHDVSLIPLAIHLRVHILDTLHIVLLTRNLLERVDKCRNHANETIIYCLFNRVFVVDEFRARARQFHLASRRY